MTRNSLESGRTTRWRGVAAALALCGAAAGGAAEEAATLYQWKDSEGIYRYTPDLGRVPGYARDTAVEIRPDTAPPPAQTPVYFDPDPRSPVVAVPNQPPETATTAEAAPGTPAASSAAASGTDARIRELEALIARDEEALKERIAAPGSDADTAVSPELREIAARLPRLQAELASLREQRDRSSEP